jgi:hypothetical protein
MKLSLLEFSQRCLANIDYDHLTFFDLKNGADSSFSTYPDEWLTHYLTRKYHEQDFVLLKNSYLPFAWGEKISKNITPLQRQIFKEAQDFGIYKGITIPFSSTQSAGALTISFNTGGKFSQSQFLKVSSDLHFFCQMIMTYRNLLETDEGSQDSTLNLLNEVATWQAECNNQKKRKESVIIEILSDIRAAQLFISHHETKDLSLETLHRAYKDIERLA